MVKQNVVINAIEYREKLSDGFIKLLNSERGVASKLAKSVGKPPSFINEIKRGNPVNALHLKAVAIVFGTPVVLDLMGINDIKPATEVAMKNRNLNTDISNRLIELERISPAAFEMVKSYITGAHEAAKATAGSWDGIERRSKKRRSETKEDLGFKSQKNGTDE